MQPGDTFRSMERALELMRAGRMAEAEREYRGVLKTEPDNPSALNMLGVARAQQGDTGEAIVLLSRALAVTPDFTAAHNNLGCVYHGIGRFREAEEAFRRALALAPADADAPFNVGNALYAQGRHDEAADFFAMAIERTPDRAVAWNNLGLTRHAQGSYRDAERAFRRALQADATYAEAYSNLGMALTGLDRPDDAVESCRRALRLRETYPEGWVNLGSALHILGRFDEAIDCSRRAQALQPDFASAHWNEALSLLCLQRYEEGWRKSEWRWRLKDTGAMPRLARALWLGEAPLAGRRILLHAEQGLGDSMLMLRHVPRLIEAGAEVFLWLPETLRGLAARSFPSARVLAVAPDPGHCDFQLPMMSLPLALRVFDAAAIGGQAPYLIADPARREVWRRRLAAGERLRVGLVWRGNPKNLPGRNRSIDFDDFASLLDAADAQFVALQKDMHEEEAAALAARGVLAVDVELADFDDTAALLAELDLLITIDTSVAHLAGALGLDFWLLQPYSSDWRWLAWRGVDDSLWYPGARRFRQERPGDWHGPMSRIAQALSTTRLGRRPD